MTRTPGNDALEHPLVRDYLERLRDEAGRLPADQAHELYADIAAHLREALGDDPTEQRVREQLERVGSPGLLVAEAGAPQPQPPPGRRSRQAGLAAVTLLVLAEILFFLPTLAVLVWLVGLVLLAVPREWTGAEKLRGYLSLGTGLPVVFVLLSVSLVQGSSSSCTSSSSVRADGAVVESPLVCTEAAGTAPWVAVVALALTLGYLGWQVLTARLLVRRLAR